MRHILGNRKRSIAVLLGALSLLGMPVWAIAADNKPVTEVIFGVVPQQSASRLAKVWVPVLASLSSDIGMTVRFVTARNIPTFERCLAIGAYDVAYMNPLHYVHFHDISGYEAIAHRSQKKLKGILVARRDSDINGISDLGGGTIAFPSPAAFGASVLPRAELSQKNILFAPKYVSSHDSVYRTVASGIMEAGGGVMRTFKTIPEEVRSQLKIIYTTNAYTPHAIAYRKGYSMAVAGKVQQGLMALSERAPDKLALLGITAFQAATNEDWDDVRKLEIPPSDFDTRKVRRLQCR